MCLHAPYEWAGITIRNNGVVPSNSYIREFITHVEGTCTQINVTSQLNALIISDYYIVRRSNQYRERLAFLCVRSDLLTKIFAINIMPTIATIPDMDIEIIQFSSKAICVQCPESLITIDNIISY